MDRAGFGRLGAAGVLVAALAWVADGWLGPRLAGACGPAAGPAGGAERTPAAAEPSGPAAPPLRSAPRGTGEELAAAGLVERSVVAAPGGASLAVLVQARDDGRPLEGVRVGRTQLVGRLRIDLSAAYTDREGRVELQAAPGVDLEVSALGVRGGAGAATVAVAPLRDGERREVTIPLAVFEGAAFHGRLVADESGRPLAGVRVVAGPGAGQFRSSQGAEDAPGPEVVVTATDEQGVFALPWFAAGGRLARFGPPLRGLAWIHVPDTFPSRAHPREFRLARAATLAVSVRDPLGRALADVEVQVSARTAPLQAGVSREDEPDLTSAVWLASTDALGVAQLRGLTPDTELGVLLAGEGGERRTVPGGLRLAAGERRELALVLGGASVVGTVRGADGRPVGGVALRVEGLDGTVWGAVGRTSDAQGGFRVDGVPPGRFEVRAPPASLGRRAPPPCVVEPLAFDVPRTRGSVELDVRAVCGATIRGRVELGPCGADVVEHRVAAVGVDSGQRVVARPQADGAFELGPLLDEPYVLDLALPGCAACRAEGRTVVRAGERDARLRLVRGARLAGILLDPQLVTIEDREIRVARRDPAGASDDAAAFRGSGGFFELNGLAPGCYDLTVRTGDGRIGSLEGVQLASGEAREDLRIALAAGGRLLLVHAGAAPWTCVLRQGGRSLGAVTLRPGTREVVTCHAGEVAIDVLEGGVPLATLRRTVGAGALETVALDPQSW